MVNRNLVFDLNFYVYSAKGTSNNYLTYSNSGPRMLTATWTNTTITNGIGYLSVNGSLTLDRYNWNIENSHEFIYRVPSNPDSNIRYLMAWTNVSSTSYGVIRLTTQSNILYLQITAGDGTVYSINTNKVVGDNLYHHFVVTCSSNNPIRVYLDGVLVATSPQNGFFYCPYTSQTGGAVVTLYNQYTEITAYKLLRAYLTPLLPYELLENYKSLQPLNPSNIFINESNTWYYTKSRYGG